MPLVNSQAWFFDKIAQYKIQNLDTNTNDTSDQETDVIEAPLLRLGELVPAICSRVLATDPGLVADVASGKVPHKALNDLIGRAAEKESLKAGFFRDDLLKQALDFLFGYGPLQPYIEDDDISDIDGTGPGSFTIKRSGRRQMLNLSFADDQAYDTFCRLVIIRNGGVINENDSHCRVSDERYRLRINVAVPPRSIGHSIICIRKHRRKHLDLHDLAALGMLDETLVRMLTELAHSSATVLFCGKGAAGKTTLLRAFIHAAAPLERILIAESETEIYPEKPCCMVQQVKKGLLGGHPVTLRDLVRDGLTMSLDTYCIGEIVGEEAFEFIRAAFSGHRCLATIHAHCAADALDRLLLLAQPASRGDAELALKNMLGRCINYVVHLHEFRVRQVLQIRGYLEKEGRYEGIEVWPKGENPSPDAAASEHAEPLVQSQGGPALRL